MYSLLALPSSTCVPCYASSLPMHYFVRQWVCVSVRLSLSACFGFHVIPVLSFYLSILFVSVSAHPSPPLSLPASVCIFCSFISPIRLRLSACPVSLPVLFVCSHVCPSFCLGFARMSLWAFSSFLVLSFFFLSYFSDFREFLLFPYILLLFNSILIVLVFTLSWPFTSFLSYVRFLLSSSSILVVHCTPDLSERSPRRGKNV